MPGSRPVVLVRGSSVDEGMIVADDNLASLELETQHSIILFKDRIKKIERLLLLRRKSRYVIESLRAVDVGPLVHHAQVPFVVSVDRGTWHLRPSGC